MWSKFSSCTRRPSPSMYIEVSPNKVTLNKFQVGYWEFCSVIMKLPLLYYDILCYTIAVRMFILCFVCIMLDWNLFMGKGSVKFGGADQVVELLWTTVASVFVLVLCALNAKFITSDVDCYARETIKIVGHRWYWTYEYPEESQWLVFNKGLFFSWQANAHSMWNALSFDSYVGRCGSFIFRTVFKFEDGCYTRSIKSFIFCPSPHGAFIGYCAELYGARTQNNAYNDWGKRCW